LWIYLGTTGSINNLECSIYSKFFSHDQKQTDQEEAQPVVELSNQGLLSYIFLSCNTGLVEIKKP